MTLRIFSNGGGVQSTAALILAAQKRIDYSIFIFSNVGKDSENPATLDYVQNVQKPFALAHGIELIELCKTRRNGETETLLQFLKRAKSSIPIPVRMSNGAPGNRACTTDYKIKVIYKWLKAHGATKANPATVGLGITLDELQRMKTDDPRLPAEHKEYPLIDLRLTRAACMKIIQDAGLPIPPKSSCYFCPFHSPAEWMRIKRETPDLFQKAADLDDMINTRRANQGKNRVYLHPYLISLSQLEGIQEEFHFDDDSMCDSGYCMV